MACEHVRLPDGTAAIICGLRRKKAAPCQFCGRPGTKLCDWPVEKPEKISHVDLKPDDTVVTVQAKLHLRVRSLQRFTAAFRLWKDSGKEWLVLVPEKDRQYWRESRVAVVDGFSVTMYGLTFPKDRGSFLCYCVGKDQVTVLRPGTCDSPCCEQCSREVGEDRDYCKSHWKSWETIA